MHIYCLRHGETNYNLRGLCNDDPADGVYLTDQGMEQARRAAEQLKHVPIRRILVSRLPRTHQTAGIVNRYHGAPVTIHPGIDDLRSGFNNRPSREHRQAIAADPLHIRPPGGESLLEHKARVLGFVDWLTQLPEPVVLIVAHEETLRVLAAYAAGWDDQQMLGVPINNCELLYFETA